MAMITYVEFDGRERVLDIAAGSSVMQGAVNNNVRGIIAECGGSCSCATCHVYVDEAWMGRLANKTEPENALLDAVCAPRPNSRLACQIEVSEALDGLIVRIPAKQV